MLWNYQQYFNGALTFIRFFFFFFNGRSIYMMYFTHAIFCIQRKVNVCFCTVFYSKKCVSNWWNLPFPHRNCKTPTLYIVVQHWVVIVCLTSTTVGCFRIITAAPTSDADFFHKFTFKIKFIMKYVAFWFQGVSLLCLGWGWGGGIGRNMLLTSAVFLNVLTSSVSLFDPLYLYSNKITQLHYKLY